MSTDKPAELQSMMDHAREAAFAAYVDDGIHPWDRWPERDKREFTAMIRAAAEPLAAEVIRLRAEMIGFTITRKEDAA